MFFMKILNSVLIFCAKNLKAEIVPFNWTKLYRINIVVFFLKVNSGGCEVFDTLVKNSALNVNKNVHTTNLC